MLTPPQKKVLEFLHKNKKVCAYDLKGVVSRPMKTLKALENKGLVKGFRGVGSIWSPQTNIDWVLTEKGKKVLENNK